MSDEYEYEDDDRKPRMTFGQILASLLLLGVVVVIGLLVLLYFKLTSPVERSNYAPAAVSAPVRPVERFTPDGKTVTDANQTAVATASSAASEVAAQQKAADEAVQNLQNNTAGNAPVNGLNSGALTGGAAVGAAAAARKQQAAQRRRREAAAAANGDNTPRRRQQQQQYTEADEVPLQPIQRGERRLTPRNTQQGERTLTPRNTQQQQGERTLTPRRSNQAAPADLPQRPIRINPPAEQRERTLTPTRPKSGKSGEFDELF